MALEDIKAPGRRQCNIYRIVFRFLRANVGKPWASVYSRLCASADSRTYKGEQLRSIINRDVDMNGIRLARWRNDFFVDDAGILRELKENKTWKSSWEVAKQRAPVVRIYFAKDGPDLWYELIEIPDGPRASKYTKMYKTWFCITRTVEKDTYVVTPSENAARNIGLKKGKKNWYKETTTETRRQTAVASKLLHILQALAAKTNPSGHKILRLEYHWNHAKDEHSMTAYVSGHSQ